MKKAYLTSNTCIRGQLYLNLVKEFLLKNNFSLTFRIQNADLIIFNACGFVKHAQKHSIEIIKEINKKKKQTAEVIVFGCFPKMDKEKLQTIFNGVSFGYQEMDVLNKIISAKIKIKDIIYCQNTIPKASFKQRTFLGKTFELICAHLFSHNIYNQFYIKIADGCLGDCSYCVEKKAWGYTKSKPIKNVMNEFRVGLRNGYKQFRLEASDCGSYGKDIGMDLVELLERMIREDGDYEIAISFINPRWLIEMFPRLKKIFSSGKINYICTTVQSGSDKILKLMNRHYTVEEFRKCVKYLNDNFPSIILATDIIIGFPGETEEDFEKTLNLISNELDFKYVTANVYSDIKGTKSYELPNKLPNSVKKRRFKKFLCSRIFKKISFILDVKHPHSWLKYSFEHKH